MKNRLFFSIISGYLFIIVLGTLGVSLSFKQAADREFKNYVFRNQFSIAERAAQSITEYYKMHDGFEGLQEYLHPMAPGHSRMGMMLGGFIVTDRNLTVVADTAGTAPPGRRLQVPRDKGIAILGSSGIVGYIFPPHLVDPRLPPEDRGVIAAIQQGAAVSLAIVVLVSIILAIIFSLYLANPIKAMNSASRKIGEGDFSVRIHLKRKDEIGDLGRGFNKMARSLEEAENWRKQIISDTAHELRTPVSLLTTRLELLSEGIYPVSPDELDKLSGELSRLQRLIDQLEELSGLEGAGYRLNLETFDVNEMVSSRIEFFSSEAAVKGIQLFSEASGQVQYSGDRELLSQVVDNLVSNSLRYTPSGGMVRVSAFIDGEGSGRFLKIVVGDSGPGIPDDETEKIFQRYYRVDRSRSSGDGGRGLGLAIALEICRLHNGGIKAGRNGELGGAEFTVSLPVFG